MSKLARQQALPRRKLFKPADIIKAGRSLGGKGNAVLAQILVGKVGVRKAKKAKAKR